MPRDLLVEIGTEEIPAGFLARAMADLEQRTRSMLEDSRLSFADVAVYGTPRRLTVITTGVAEVQPDVSERLVGPPARVAFDSKGVPTKAAIGFAARNGVDVSALERGEVEGKKGEYVLCTRHEPGRPALEVLPGVITELIESLPWPKSMRWGSGEQSFVRPVHWLVVLYGGELLPVSFAGIDAGRASRGHRFLSPQARDLDGSAVGYAESMREAFVVVDSAKRRTMISAELARIEGETGLSVRPDEELLAEVVNLVEYPVAVCGEFDPAYLEVPEEVIVSAMRSHQRYFAMNDASGALANRFVTVAGTITRDPDVVRRGNERVLAARLADAQFFFREDQKVSLDTLAARLDGVVFQKKLGTVGAKVGRVGAISARIAGSVKAPAAEVARAAALAKADLLSNMVGEFPDLQGVMGRRYAELAGEPAAVCLAIEEHYLPRGASDALPSSDVGAAVGVADRIDTIVGCFAAGLQPTGSADPYGLRRAALGILRILDDRGWSFGLSDLVTWAAGSLEGTLQVSKTVRGEVLDFFLVRLKGLLAESGELSGDCIDAALAVGFDDVPDARARAQAVSRLRQRADFEPVAIAFKRVANILKGEAVAGEVDPAAFVNDDERALWTAFSEIDGRVRSYLRSGDYQSALHVLAELKDPVDRFFEAVLVMDKDDRIRKNRLALLGRINATFTRIADFRQLAV